MKRLWIVLGFLTLSLPAHSDELTVYFIPSPSGIDWSTPRSMIQDVLVAQVGGKAHSIGHVNIRIDCPTLGRTVLTGMTSEGNTEERELLFERGYGLGILFHTFLGRLDRENEIEPDLRAMARERRLTSVRFAISTPTCARLLEFYDGFVARGDHLKYGLPNRPRYGEGAGCSAFGASFIELAGLMNDEFRAFWSLQKRVPAALVGGPMTGERVTVLDLLNSGKNSRWALPHLEKGWDLFFWDPDRMDAWVRDTWTRESRAPENMRRYQPGTDFGGPSLFVDARRVPTPQDPIWKSAQ
jgi:hypothetical protein